MLPCLAFHWRCHAIVGLTGQSLLGLSRRGKFASFANNLRKPVREAVEAFARSASWQCPAKHDLVNEPSVYVLYRDNIPYCVGQATKLRHRLWSHAGSPGARYGNFLSRFAHDS